MEHIQFVKGNSLDKFNQWKTDNPNGANALFVDTTKKKIYLDGSALDSKLQVLTNIGDDGIPHKSYSFIDMEGNTTVISEAAFVSLDDITTMDLTAESHTAGFMSVEDKFTLKNIASSLGVSIIYEYVYVDGSLEKSVYNRDSRWYNDVECTTEFSNSAIIDALKTSSAKKAHFSQHGATIDPTFDKGTSNGSTAMLTPHGNLDKGTTMDELSKMSISQILKNILFEFAVPSKYQSASVSLSLNGYDTIQELGAPYPTSSNFSISTNNEIWLCKTNNGTIVENTRRTISKFDSVAYTLNNGAIPTDGKIVAGDNGPFVATATFIAQDDAVDTNGSSLNASTGTKYCAAHGTSSNSSKTIKGDSFIYTNASKISTSSLWDDRNTDPGAYKGDDVALSSSIFVSNATNGNFYVQWPKGTTDEEHFYLYIPSTHQITSVGGANDTATDVWNAALTKENVGTQNITNKYSVSVPYTKYKISKAAGITTAKITISTL